MKPKLSLGALAVLGATLAACGAPVGNDAVGTGNTSDPAGIGTSAGDSNGPGVNGNLPACSDCPASSGYFANQCAAADNVELHLCKDGHHFASVITTKPGALVIRTHPGNDPNGWGSSLYLHSFLSNTTGLAGATSAVQSVSGAGIAVRGSGPVNGAGSSTYGHWSWLLVFNYDAGSKTVWTTGGSYNVSLSSTLGGSGQDLNLLRISSNYLHDVPLLYPGGTLGDTGDMKNVKVSAQSFHYSWIPPRNPNFYPRNTADQMTIDAVGQRNVVDTARGSGKPIAAAYKPGLTVTLASRRSGLPMIFGAAYDTTKATDFAADNVGITPIVLKSWGQKSVIFDITLVSAALPGDR